MFVTMAIYILYFDRDPSFILLFPILEFYIAFFTKNILKILCKVKKIFMQVIFFEN